MWVDLIPSIEDLKRKDWGPWEKKKSCLKIAFNSRFQHQFSLKFSACPPALQISEFPVPKVTRAKALWQISLFLSIYKHTHTHTHTHTPYWFCSSGEPWLNSNSDSQISLFMWITWGFCSIAASASVVLGWGLRLCIPKFPGDADVVGLLMTLWVATVSFLSS